MPFNSHVTAKVFKIFLIWVYLFSFELEVFLDADLLVTYTGGDAYILEKFSFSSWSKIFFIFAKSMVFSTFLNCKSFFNSWKMSVFSLVTSYHLYACLNFFFPVLWLSVVKVSFTFTVVKVWFTFTTVTSLVVLPVLLFSFILSSFRMLLLSTLTASLCWFQENC